MRSQGLYLPREGTCRAANTNMPRSASTSACCRAASLSHRLLPGFHCCSLCSCLLRRPRLLPNCLCRRLHLRLLLGCHRLRLYLHLLPGCCLRVHLRDHLRMLLGFHLCRAAASTSARCPTAAAPTFCRTAALAMQLFVYAPISASTPFGNSGQQLCSYNEVTVLISGSLLPGIAREQTSTLALLV